LSGGAGIGRNAAMSDNPLPSPIAVPPATGATLRELGALTAQWTEAGVIAAIAVAAALVLHMGLFALLRRVVSLSPTRADDAIVSRLRRPARFLMAALALGIAAPLNPLLTVLWADFGRLIVAVLLGWCAFALVGGIADGLDQRASSQGDTEGARSQRTRIRILSRTLRFVIGFVVIALMLFAIPGVRTIGTTLLASAGLAGLAVGAAAQPALKSLIAGLQIALTEPIRIDDYIVIEGEAGRVEDIRLSYVVIRTGDERRLIVPTAKFLDGSFQNWTRAGGGILGSVLLPILPGNPVEPIRAAYLAAIDKEDDWDRRNASLQVSEAKIDAVELKLVMSAAEPGALNRLRNTMREIMLDWLRCNMPEALKTEAGDDDAPAEPAPPSA
jgi:small-conductance mechanosensitive channel